MLGRAKRRRIDPLEYVFLLWKGFMQISVEFEKPSDTQRALEEVVKCLNSFRVRSGWFWLYETKNEPEIFKIPSNLNTLHEVNEWMYWNHTPPVSKALATVAVDETRLVVNNSHVTGDGVYHASLIQHLSNPNETWDAAPLPMAPSARYYDEIMASKYSIDVPANEKNTCRLFPKMKPDTDKTSTYEQTVVRHNARDLKCWDAQQGRIHGLSEALWTAMGLMSSAHLGKFPDSFGLMTCVNLRKTVSEEERKRDKSLQDFFADVCVRAKPTLDMTIGELGNRLRCSFNEAMARKDYNPYLKAVWRVIYRPWTQLFPVPGLGLEMSSIGPVKIKRPVKDGYITLMTPKEYGVGSVCFMNYSIIDEERGRNEFIGHLQFNTQEMAKPEGEMFARGLEHCLLNFGANKRVGEAIDELQQFVPKIK